MKTLQIRWQRLVNEQGETCDRCGMTEAAVTAAVHQLKQALQGLGIDVTVSKEALSSTEFHEGPLESNRIWIGNKPLEQWLSATTGQSRCCAACGNADCRTLTVDGQTFEAIPVELIIRAGLMAAAELLQNSSGETCCEPEAPEPSSGGCCPAPSAAVGCGKAGGS